MNRIFSIACLFLTLIIFAESKLLGQNGDGEYADRGREIIYTFIGPTATSSLNWVNFHNFYYGNTPYRETESLSGINYGGGIIFAIYSDRFSGDFSINFLNNTLGNLSLYHLHYTSSGRLNIHLGETFGFTPGIGLYFESAPSNEKLSGGGGLYIPVGLIINTSFDTKLFFDVFFKYGFFGLGDNSTKLSIGINLGFVFKVGRI